MNDNRKGYFIITQNNNKHDYIRMAYALALSIKITQTEVNDVSIALPGTEVDLVTEEQRKVFDQVVELPWADDAVNAEWKINNKWKLAQIYKKNLLKTYICLDLTKLLDKLNFYDEKIFKKYYRITRIKSWISV